jgi:hypothetical protein
MDAIEFIDEPAVEEELIEPGGSDLSTLGTSSDELILR